MMFIEEAVEVYRKTSKLREELRKAEEEKDWLISELEYKGNGFFKNDREERKIHMEASIFPCMCDLNLNSMTKLIQTMKEMFRVDEVIIYYADTDYERVVVTKEEWCRDCSTAYTIEGVGPTWLPAVEIPIAYFK